jgi:probable F420-dependent oxidoreductase
MSRIAQFGIRLPVAGPLADPAAIRQTARYAEDLAYDTVWVHDYVIWTRELNVTHVSCGAAEIVDTAQDPVFFESLTTLAFVAAHTSAIRLGTAVYCVPYREPVVAAKQIATIDALSGGRLTLGVGVGATRQTHNREFEVLGIPRTQKYALTEEYVAAMKALWDGASAFDGVHVRFTGAEMYPLPVQRPAPPLWVGGSGGRAMDMVARWGDGWLPGWLTPAGFSERIGQLHELVSAAGRNPDQITIGTEIVACIQDTDAKAASVSDRTMQTLSSGFTVRSAEDARGASLIGSVETVRQRVEEFADAGVQHFEVKFIYRDVTELWAQMEALASVPRAEVKQT